MRDRSCCWRGAIPGMQLATSVLGMAPNYHNLCSSISMSIKLFCKELVDHWIGRTGTLKITAENTFSPLSLWIKIRQISYNKIVCKMATILPWPQSVKAYLYLVGVFVFAFVFDEMHLTPALPSNGHPSDRPCLCNDSLQVPDSKVHGSPAQ